MSCGSKIKSESYSNNMCQTMDHS
jgi:hypothetical protein